MRISYGVVWHDQEIDQPGRLVLAPHSLQLVSFKDEADVIRELPFDEVRAVTVRPSEHPSETGPGRAVVVLETADGGSAEIESMVDKWLLADFLHKVFVHGLTGGRGRDRMLVSVKLVPGTREAALALLEAGPPFDPAETALTAHDVYLLDDEVLFLFETDDRESLVEQVLHFWEPASAWREVMAGDVRLAEHAYSWRRNELSPVRGVHIGLGL